MQLVSMASLSLDELLREVEQQKEVLYGKL